MLDLFILILCALHQARQGSDIPWPDMFRNKCTA